VDASALFEDIRKQLIGRTVGDRQLAANSFSVWVDTDQSLTSGFIIGFEPSWNLVGPTGVMAGSRQAQDEDDPSGWQAVKSAVDIVVGRQIESVERDPLTGTLQVVLSGKVIVSTFVTDPRDGRMWYVRDVGGRRWLSASPKGITVREAA
jgi:hypothetical protein